MTPKKRNSKGRFISPNGEGREARNFTLIVLALVAFTIVGSALVLYGQNAGYAQGYKDGLSDNQPVIFKAGFEKGIEFEKNWEVSYTYGNRDTAVCKKSDPTSCKMIDKNYNDLWTFVPGVGVYGL